MSGHLWGAVILPPTDVIRTRYFRWSRPAAGRGEEGVTGIYWVEAMGCSPELEKFWARTERKRASFMFSIAYLQRAGNQETFVELIKNPPANHMHHPLSVKGPQIW